MQRTLAGFVLCLTVASVSWADDAPNFFVAPLLTELHRTVVSPTADVYAIVNCNALIVNNDVNLSALNESGFVAAMSVAKQDRRRLLLTCRYQYPAKFVGEQTDRLIQRLKDLSVKAGMQKVSVAETWASEDWNVAYRRVADFHEAPGVEESPVENALVRAFPVRTRLSKFSIGDVDCIIDVYRSIDGRMTDIPPLLKSSIAEAVKATNLREKRTILFKVQSTEAGRKKIETLFDPNPPPTIPKGLEPKLQKTFEDRAAGYRPSAALKLANDLGFQNMRCMNSPGGGAPETLIGGVAPNFTLNRVNGESLELRDFILGRPALIAFWGLACGPCRQEAPWLSAMQQKYGNGLSIIGVNGYNDERAAVEEYVKSAKLSHAIVLQGKSVSENLYHVGAYPTTFLVDRAGTVIDYEVGFESSKRLEERVMDLVKH